MSETEFKKELEKAWINAKTQENIIDKIKNNTVKNKTHWKYFYKKNEENNNEEKINEKNIFKQ
jgi:hypothetical protein